MSEEEDSADDVLNTTVSHYFLSSVLGRGEFSKVYKGDSLNDLSIVAVKVVLAEELEDVNKQAKVHKEIDALKKLQHPNIIRIIDTNEEFDKFSLILEYASHGDMLEFYLKHGSPPMEMVRFWYDQVIRAVAFLHNNGYIHRDLKLDNFLLDNDLNVKIADFGFIARVNPEEASHTWFKLACGSPAYAAPEILGLPDDSEDDSYNHLIMENDAGSESNGYLGPPVDVWSLGVCLYAMTCGWLPFEEGDMDNLYDCIMNARYEHPSSAPMDAQDLIGRMLVVNPCKRISLQDVSQHLYLHSVIDQSTFAQLRIEFMSNQKRVENEAVSPLRADEDEQLTAIQPSKCADPDKAGAHSPSRPDVKEFIPDEENVYTIEGDAVELENSSKSDMDGTEEVTLYGESGENTTDFKECLHIGDEAKPETSSKAKTNDKITPAEDGPENVMDAPKNIHAVNDDHSEIIPNIADMPKAPGPNMISPPPFLFSAFSTPLIEETAPQQIIYKESIPNEKELIDRTIEIIFGDDFPAEYYKNIPTSSVILTKMLDYYTRYPTGCIALDELERRHEYMAYLSRSITEQLRSLLQKAPNKETLLYNFAVLVTLKAWCENTRKSGSPAIMTEKLQNELQLLESSFIDAIASDVRKDILWRFNLLVSGPITLPFEENTYLSVIRPTTIFMDSIQQHCTLSLIFVNVWSEFFHMLDASIFEGLMKRAKFSCGLGLSLKFLINTWEGWSNRHWSGGIRSSRPDILVLTRQIADALTLPKETILNEKQEPNPTFREVCPDISIEQLNYILENYDHDEFDSRGVAPTIHEGFRRLSIARSRPAQSSPPESPRAAPSSPRVLSSWHASPAHLPSLIGLLAQDSQFAAPQILVSACPDSPFFA